ncbi:hypothetical protein [Oceanobacillus piezotolerans]|uniref:hypothetical protein n=1 Tax=Oceanobacillus piezotolerans TaxID=2448030 RepID=UPI0016571D64|nr:hypothetical protein [Oceanobacillus piezotolerans]
MKKDSFTIITVIILAFVSMFTGEIVTMVMLGFILISLQNIHNTLKELLVLQQEKQD